MHTQMVLVWHYTIIKLLMIAGQSSSFLLIGLFFISMEYPLTFRKINPQYTVTELKRNTMIFWLINPQSIF